MAIFATASLQAAVTVDTFNIGTSDLLYGGTSSNFTGISTSETIGGERYVEVFGPATIYATVDHPAADGQVTYNSGITDDGSMILDYGRTTALGVDLSVSGENDRFRFDFVLLGEGFGAGNDTLKIDVEWDDAGTQTSSSTVNWPTSTGTFDILFSSFGGSTPDWTAIDRITITIDGRQASDVAIDSFGAVPEPATASMMALVACLGFLIRRHFVA